MKESAQAMDNESPTPKSGSRVVMNNNFKPKLKKFYKDYQSPYRYTNNTSVNKSLDNSRVSIEK